MENQEKYIELHPGHWLYNAGVIGFLLVLKQCYGDIENFFQSDGTIYGNISKVFLEKRNHKGYEVPEIIWQWVISSGKKLKNNFDEKGDDPVKDIWGTLFNLNYRGFFNANSNLLYATSNTSQPIFKSFLKFVDSLFEYNTSNSTCSFCIKKGKQTYKNRFSSEHYKELGGSDSSGGMPNSFWNNQKSLGGTELCDTCSFLLLNRHLAFTWLNDWTKIFINAPSFKLMYELNRLINSSFEWSRDNNYRSLLAISVIEYCVKSNTLLSTWSAMNIEIIAITKKNIENNKSKDVIEYYTLPYSIIQLISNKRIATILRDIGEFKILNFILDRKYKELIELSYRIIKISIKEDFNRGDKNFINDYLFLPQNKKDQTALRLVANKILKLYALIEEQLKTT